VTLRRRAGWLAGIGISGLLVLGAAYRLTSEQARSIRVRWRADVSPQQQAELEHTYLLVNARGVTGRSVAYDLLDSSQRNIKALVFDPLAEDTTDIDRRNYDLRASAAPVERRTWVGNRTPGLRNAAVLWTLIVGLAAIALAGVASLVRDLGGAAFRRARRIDREDLWRRGRSRFDCFATWITADAADRRPDRPVDLLAKAIVGTLVVAAVGLPVIETWQALLLAAIWLAIVFGVVRNEPRRLAAAAGIVLAVVAIKAVLPRADIAEADNAFMVIHDGEPLQKGLPENVFQSWKAQFEALYPPIDEPDPAPGTWRAAGVPTTLFAPSTDAIWRKAKYTRQVDAVRFRSLREFRGGFANEIQYNFWFGQLSRDSMPFYVMYELTPASVGGQLSWQGQLFWERPDGGFEEVVHEQVAGRAITERDAGRRVYAAFFSEQQQAYFAIEPPLGLRLSGWLRNLLAVTGCVSVLMLTVRWRRGAYVRALGLFAAAYWMMTSSGIGQMLGRSYPPQGGGGDGLVFDGFGRQMAMLAGRGQIGEALKGAEPVYWFTPGTRYFRMVEKLIFGDTNHLYALLLACLPVVVFYLFRHFTRARAAAVIALTFCIIPVGNLSFLQYMANARMGYGEAVAGGLFLLALALMLRSQPAWGGTAGTSSFVVGIAGAALAGSMFIRPNFAIAVIWLSAAYTWASWRRKDVAGLVALAIGLGLAVWMPFHNWHYGGQFHLVSASTDLAVPVRPGDYAAALADVARGRWDSSEVALVTPRLRGWLWGPGFYYDGSWIPYAWAAHVAKLVSLIATLYVAIRWVIRRASPDTALAVVAIASICAHVPMLFIFSSNYRFAMLGWDLSLVVLIVALARAVSARRQPDHAVTGVRTVLTHAG
jgi:hypothetical protein